MMSIGRALALLGCAFFVSRLYGFSGDFFSNQFLQEDIDFKKKFSSRDVRVLVDFVKKKFVPSGKASPPSELRRSLEIRQVTLPGFFISESLETLCKIKVGLYHEEHYFADGFVCSNVSSDLEIDTIYTVLRQKSIDQKKKKMNKNFVYYYVGSIVIKNFLDQETLAIGYPVHDNIFFQGGDIVVPYRSVQRVLKEKKVYGEASFNAKIISFGIEEILTAGDGNFVFMDKGTEDGVEEGLFYKVYRSNALLSRRKDIMPSVVRNPNEIAEVRIVDAGLLGSIGYVEYATSEIFIGDIVNGESI